MLPKAIETVPQLVTAFGGTKALADWADVVPSTVSNWKDHGHIPNGWHFRLYLECRKRKLKISPKLFNIGERLNTRSRRVNGGRAEQLA